MPPLNSTKASSSLALLCSRCLSHTGSFVLSDNYEEIGACDGGLPGRYGGCARGALPRAAWRRSPRRRAPSRRRAGSLLGEQSCCSIGDSYSLCARPAGASLVHHDCEQRVEAAEARFCHSLLQDILQREKYLYLYISISLSTGARIRLSVAPGSRGLNGARLP